MVALALVVLTHVGVLPSPAYLAKRFGLLAGERYPCEGGACGCMSARECWTTCTCHTLAWKAAWAQREGVAVPDWVGVGGRALAADQGVACPLCAHEDADDAEVAPSGKAMPTLSVAGCKALDVLLVIGLAARIASTAPAWRPAPSPWCEFAVPVDSRVPESAGIRPPAPPPRAFA